MKFYYYKGRHGEEHLTEHTERAWFFLLKEMQRDNNMTFVEAQREGFEVEGSFEEGYLYMDDGGSIHTLTLTEPQ